MDKKDINAATVMIGLIIEQVGLDMKKRNMKMSCLIANNVNTLQLEKID